MTKIEVKARRRIRRFIKSGVHQARVYQISEKVYEYKEKHHITSIFFKRDVIGRLRKITQN